MNPEEKAILLDVSNAPETELKNIFQDYSLQSIQGTYHKPFILQGMTLPYIWDELGSEYLDFVSPYYNLHDKALQELYFQVYENYAKKMQVGFHPYFISRNYVEIIDKLSQGLSPQLTRFAFYYNCQMAQYQCLSVVSEYFQNKRMFILTDKQYPSYQVSYPSVSHERLFTEQFVANNIDSFKEKIEILRSDPKTSQVGAVIIEPLNIYNGQEYTPEFIQQIRTICLKENILFVVDESQTAFCTTGDFVYYKRFGFVPDILLFSFPLKTPFNSISGFVVHQDIVKRKPLNFSVTYSNALISEEDIAKSVAFLDLAFQESICNQVMKISEQLHAYLMDLQSKYPQLISCIQGKGLYHFITFTPRLLKLFKKSLNWLPENLKNISVNSNTFIKVISLYLCLENKILLNADSMSENTLAIYPHVSMNLSHLEKLYLSLDKALQLGELKLFSKAAKEKFIYNLQKIVAKL